MSSKVFEVLVAGRLASALIYGLARARSEIVLPRIVPYCCKNILELTESEYTASSVRCFQWFDEVLLSLSNWLRGIKVICGLVSSDSVDSKLLLIQTDDDGYCWAYYIDTS